jgi:hypothetical protein
MGIEACLCRLNSILEVNPGRVLMYNPFEGDPVS